MKIYYIIFFILLYNFGEIIISAKPIFDSLSDDRCNPSEIQDYGKIAPISSSDLLNKPRSQFQTDKFAKPVDFNLKRSLLEDNLNNLENEVQKRQVGVVYKEDKPIGILQPYQRSYRFIPVKDEPMTGLDDQFSLEKRSLPEINLASDQYLEESYPSIYTSFKIDSKLEKKRNNDLEDEDITNLKSTIRRLRAANPQNTEKVEEELKNILDDMGLIEENTVEKRDVGIDRSKREQNMLLDHPSKSSDSNCPTGNSLLKMEQKNQVKTDFNRSPPVEKRNNKERKKRQHIEDEREDVVNGLQDSGELRLSGNKSPLAFKSEIARDAQDEDADDSLAPVDENRVQRQIQKRIDSLKEEVKREIKALRQQAKNSENTEEREEEDEDVQRRKRHTDSLVDEETDAVNPLINVDVGELKPLVRKRRSLEYDDEEEEDDENGFENERSRRNSQFTEKLKKQHMEENEEAGELLGDDVENENVVRKRSVFNSNEYEDDLDDRNKRGEKYDSSEYYDNFYEEERPRRESSIDYDQSGKLRIRRRINQDQELDNRPQQLGDMSDLDLFGALPKSYNGELSRYKRV